MGRKLKLTAQLNIPFFGVCSGAGFTAGLWGFSFKPAQDASVIG
jgi:hypothetical protein